MTLTTIGDLQTLQPEHRKALIERAMQLSGYYLNFKRQLKGGFRYEVYVPGDKARAPGAHASEISHCNRQLVYSMRGEKRSPPVEHADVNMQMRFSIGQAVHAMLQYEFKLMCDWMNQQNGSKCLTFEDEVAINPNLQGVSKELDLYSSCDGQFTYWFDEKPYLRVGLEIKTKSAPEFDKLAKPSQDHMEQTCFYMAALDLPLMWILYYNKSNSNFTKSEPPYLFQFNQSLWSKTLEPRIIKAQHTAQTTNLPDRQEGMYCSWCAFAEVCKPNYLTKPRHMGASATMTSPGAFRMR
jgi:CRISPR/Cas system-associated exonuclease Cas4 (RecB family)